MSFSIVIPSYNQASYLESTILSCLTHSSPREILLMDGGSTDGSVDIIRKHEAHLAYWQSQPDGGQAAAINDGFKRATGDIFCWLNSDDYFLPGALDIVAARLEPSKLQLLLGNCFHFTEGSAASHGSDLQASHNQRNLRLNDYVIQPSAFWTKTLWDKVGPLQADLNYTFDWDWFLRAFEIAEVITVPDYLSAYRHHQAHKSGTGGGRRKAEILDIYQRYLDERQFAAVQEIDRFQSETEELERNLKRLRLNAIRPAIMEKKFPKIYSVFSLSEVAQVRESLRS